MCRPLSGERPDSTAKLVVGEAAKAEYAAAADWYAKRSLAAAGRRYRPRRQRRRGCLAKIAPVPLLRRSAWGGFITKGDRPLFLRNTRQSPEGRTQDGQLQPPGRLLLRGERVAMWARRRG